MLELAAVLHSNGLKPIISLYHVMTLSGTSFSFKRLVQLNTALFCEQSDVKPWLAGLGVDFFALVSAVLEISDRACAFD